MDCSFNSRSTNSRLDLIKDLSLNYHVDWPANIILDEKSITVYNGVFLFLLQIKYTKWSLENLRLSSLRREMSKHFPFDHYLIVLRIKMLFVFTSLHDFLAHKIEAIRIQFSSKWCLPDCSYPKDINFSIPETLSFSDLVQDHNNLISELQSVCLLTESCSLLFTEIHNLCSMGLQLQDLWISNLSSGSNNSICKEKLEILSDQFGSHVKFLSSMLTRVVCSSNNNQLSYLSTCFKIAASFSSDISKPVSSK
ncbi:unnamed protein product [Heterobilharzia americana]|nr:unnamed protein product [Heterobilharzia americana]